MNDFCCNLYLGSKIGDLQDARVPAKVGSFQRDLGMFPVISYGNFLMSSWLVAEIMSWGGRSNLQPVRIVKRSEFRHQHLRCHPVGDVSPRRSPRRSKSWQKTPGEFGELTDLLGDTQSV